MMCSQARLLFWRNRTNPPKGQDDAKTLDSVPVNFVDWLFLRWNVDSGAVAGTRANRISCRRTNSRSGPDPGDSCAQPERARYSFKPRKSSQSGEKGLFSL